MNQLLEKYPSLQYKQSIIFDLDNTLYPEKDYLYQTYYLIGHLLEYQEQISAGSVIEFLISTFETSGRTGLFDKLIEKFNLNESYKLKLMAVMRTSKLPLRLIMFDYMQTIIEKLIAEDFKLFILTNGNPQQQLNKLKHLDFNGHADKLTCYFADEISPKPSPDAVWHILKKHELEADQVLFIGDSEVDKMCAENAGIDFMNVEVFGR